MSRHADMVLAAAAANDTTSLIAASWRRSANLHRLNPDATHRPERDSRALREAEERDAALIAIARPYLDRLFETLADPLGGISLVDASGLMLAVRAGRTQEAHERRLDLWVGAEASEAAIGTNGNGTCLVEERPIVVSGEAHFLSMLTHTACIAAPIFGPDGRLIGALNALTREGDAYLERLAQNVTRDFAQRIELELFAAAFPGRRLVLAAGHDPTALLSVDRDGGVVGATRAARRLLDLTPQDVAAGIDLDGLRGGSGTLAEMERSLIARTLARHGGNVARAARELGISRSTLYRKAMALPPGDAARVSGRPAKSR